MNCPKCHRKYDGKNVIVSEHHVLPKRMFGDSGATICLCFDCHAALERRIPERIKFSETVYFLIVSRFLFG
jgi:hypothetical protein